MKTPTEIVNTAIAEVPTLPTTRKGDRLNGNFSGGLATRVRNQLLEAMDVPTYRAYCKGIARMSQSTPQDEINAYNREHQLVEDAMRPLYEAMEARCATLGKAN